MFVKDGSKTEMGARPEIVNGTLYVFRFCSTWKLWITTSRRTGTRGQSD
ncbi:Uncharacterised protein [Paenibacillus thiaminolyticus]|nr:Uncharacterised protein [Paenibacillus thiaminolyticus]